MSIELPKNYEAKETESKIYQHWLDSGFFNPDNLPHSHQKPFAIVMPPPNVTGTLHLGHALGITNQDISIRYHRMRGDKTLWIPGTDHAAIATQSKVENIIYKEENKTRYDLGREEFLKRVEAFAADSQNTILDQIQKLGASCDWSRLAFTLDEPRSKAVRTAFKKMYDDEIIYRGYRIVNWDPKGQTTVSDDEVVHKERPATLYTFRYGTDFPIAISTTRPETKVGDVAVAVHPDDTRYQIYIGKTFALEFCGVPLTIQVVGDESVDPAFGTGALGVTPAHSHIDWEIAQRHHLPTKQVIDENLRIIDAGPLSGQKTNQARETILQWIRDNGLMQEEKAITQNVATAERTGAVIEPLPKLQWFINVNKTFSLKDSKIDGIISGQPVTLKQLMRHVVENGQVTIVPEHFKKTYFHWIDNLRDWCISRQIWYGHRIPVWYPAASTSNKEQEMKVSVTDINDSDWVQDSDTLDTWFSSGLWTFSTLGWPDTTKDLEFFHPTDVLETGYDILFFWIARMILMSTYLLGDIPFKTVYLHGLVRDAEKQKMSKSKGNIIDPRDMIEKYGTDALRFALIFGTASGTDIALSEDKIKGMKHFANKIWNAARYVLMSIDGLDTSASTTLTPEDQQIIIDLKAQVAEITQDIENYNLYLAAEKVYHYFWHTFADKIIEESKPKIASEDPAFRASAQWVLFEILTTTLKLLHPFMPFVTEELWSHLPITDKQLLIVSAWPK